MQLDVKAVGANLAPAQQDETLDDLAFFLDEFGSTRAVRVKLQGMESDATRLQLQVRRLLGHAAQAGREEEETTNQEETVSKSDGSAEGDVDEIMTDLDFFLRTFGSTRAVRAKLDSLRQMISGLQRTVQWLEEYRQKGKKREILVQINSTSCEQPPSLDRRLEDGGVEQQQPEHIGGGVGGNECRAESGGTGDDVEDEQMKKNGSVLTEAPEVVMLSPERHQEQREEYGDERVQSPVGAPLVGKDFVNSGVVSAYYSALRSDTEVYAGSKTSSINSVSDESEPREQLKPQQVIASTLKDKSRALCRYTDCDKLIQANGLCYRHGGYRICKLEGCDRRAVSRCLCRFHGGGTKCKIDGCDKRACSGLKGYCSRHAREQGVEIKRLCKVDGCYRQRVGQHHCQNHYSEEEVSGARSREFNEQDQPALIQEQSFSHIHDQGLKTVNSSSLRDDRQRHHVTCKAFGCLKWVKRNGDPNEYCINHRGGWRALPPETETSFIHPDGGGNSNQTDLVGGCIATEDSRTDRDRICKEPGCEKVGKTSGPKKGYCFQHGGGFTCTVEGCNKARQLKGFCASHGGYYECKVEGCKKRVVIRGYCYAHDREHVATANSPGGVERMWTSS